MTAYFDAAQRQPYVGIDAAIGIEKTVINTVGLAIEDREFPADLREKIQGFIDVWRIDEPGKLDWKRQPVQGRLYFNLTKRSRLLEELHDAFHDVAQRRHRTRFGILSDDPSEIVGRRDQHAEDLENDPEGATP